ncbi:hypothetical protein NGF19_22675 [Streptomyces sp. RY43-2]|uniref:Uncharacterized protein n=1 Tax=Streptomyces macrolidinus TaxID=2952607 RepID=A0ABT0ZIZ3_9ACTN|nr:non-canonical purine NTP pyrophosphatase [Streptomyces macrolidinus]MCN9243558.1 hypothetical protein [Streptomyces macrolidinus]
MGRLQVPASDVDAGYFATHLEVQLGTVECLDLAHHRAERALHGSLRELGGLLLSVCLADQPEVLLLSHAAHGGGAGSEVQRAADQRPEVLHGDGGEVLGIQEGALGEARGELRVGLAGHLADLTAKRTCRFASAAVYADAEGALHTFANDARKPGNVAQAPDRGNGQPSWSDLWSIFVPNGAATTLAALPEDEQNRVFAGKEFGRRGPGRVVGAVSLTSRR